MGIYLDNSSYLGSKLAGIFIPGPIRECFDYTQWRKTLIDKMESFEDLDKLSKTVKEKAVFKGNSETVVL